MGGHIHPGALHLPSNHAVKIGFHHFVIDDDEPNGQTLINDNEECR